MEQLQLSVWRGVVWVVGRVCSVNGGDVLWLKHHYLSLRIVVCPGGGVASRRES